MRRTGIAFVLLLAAGILFAGDFYVSQSAGSNSNPGTKTEPMKNIEKALKEARKGDKILVAVGNYYGLRGKGYLEAGVPLELYGGYSADFSERDVLRFPTLIQPDNKSAKKSRKALLTFKKSSAGDKIVVDGFIFDMGMRNSYHASEGMPAGLETGMLLLPPQYNKAEKDAPTVTEQCIYFPATASAGDVVIRNNVFANSAKFAIQGGHRQGIFTLVNNVFIANRMAAIEIFGTGGKKGPRGPSEKDGHVEFGHNTVLFTWSRLKDFGDMGYGFRVMTKLSYNIHDNIFGANAMTGIDDTRFNRDEWLKIDNNVFFANKQGDLMYSEAGQGQLERITVDEFEDLPFDSISGNSGEIPGPLPINRDYLAGFLNARYSEEENFDPDSHVNQLRGILGLNKQGTLASKVTMFANRYPWQDALHLFGALDGKGAQRIAQ